MLFCVLMFFACAFCSCVAVFRSFYVSFFLLFPNSGTLGVLSSLASNLVDAWVPSCLDRTGTRCPVPGLLAGLLGSGDGLLQELL